MGRLGLSNRIAVVSGAAQGIGAAVVRALAEQGTQVVAMDINADRLAEFAAGMPAHQQVLAHPLDVRDRASVERAIDSVEREVGPVEMLVNVAGILRIGPALDITDEDWATVFAVNTFGTFCLSRAVARRMMPRGHGAIVTIASNATGVVRKNMAAYAASKAASSMFTKCLGLELAAYGIRCNVVSPGSTDTPMQQGMWTGGIGRRDVIEGCLADHKVGVPLRRLADPADVAEAVIFLLSDQARHITMGDVYVDGGASLRA